MITLKSKFIITSVFGLIFMFIFVTIKDIENKSQYRYYIYQDNNYIGKCKQIEDSKYMSLVLIKNFVSANEKHIDKCYMSEKYKIIIED
jgi:hypothetical protein